MAKAAIGDLGELLAAISEQQTLSRKPPTIDPEALELRRLEAFKRWTRKCPFLVGDIVRPVPDGNIDVSNGDMTVVDVLANPDYQWGLHAGNGARIDIRLLTYFAETDSWATKWAESADFELVRRP